MEGQPSQSVLCEGEKAGHRWAPSVERLPGTQAGLEAGPWQDEWTGRPPPVGPQPAEGWQWRWLPRLAQWSGTAWPEVPQ